MKKNEGEKKLKMTANALIDVKMNYKSDVKMFRKGDYVYSRATSIPDSRVYMTFL